MSRRNSLWYKVLALTLVLALVVPVLAACDDDDDDDKTMTQPTTTTTPAPTGPVKIGLLASWTGPMALAGVAMVDPILKIIEGQLEEQGGILGGRSVEFVKGDDQSSVAGGIAGFQKLVTQEDVSAVAIGGFATATLNAVSDQAEQMQEVPFFTISSSPSDLSDRPWTVRAAYTPSMTVYGDVVPTFILDVLKPEKIAFLVTNEEEYRLWMNEWKPSLKDAGIEIVYEQYYNMDTTDFTPFLTKIKYEKPDLLVTWTSIQAHLGAIHKQMGSIGGWGDIKVLCPTAAGSTTEVVTEAEAEGSYSWVPWLPGMDTPGGKEFEQVVLEKTGKPVNPSWFLIYTTIWSAINAIEFAGSDDPADIREATRSGDFEWESPAGLLRIDTNGQNTLTGFIAQVEKGKMIPVWYPE